MGLEGQEGEQRGKSELQYLGRALNFWSKETRRLSPCSDDNTEIWDKLDLRGRSGPEHFKRSSLEKETKVHCRSVQIFIKFTKSLDPEATKSVMV